MSDENKVGQPESPKVHDPYAVVSDSLLKNPSAFGSLGRMILEHQTIKQPVVWVCMNKACLPDPARFNEHFTFESDQPRCPKCTSFGPPFIVKRVLIHLLLPDASGLLTGVEGARYFLACDPKRDYIATAHNGESGTGDPNSANCPGCLKKIADAIRKASGGKIDLSFGTKMTPSVVLPGKKN